MRKEEQAKNTTGDEVLGSEKLAGIEKGQNLNLKPVSVGTVMNSIIT